MKSALIVIDAQQSFLKRPYWSETDAPRFIERLQMLIDRCVAKQIPVLQVFHVEEEEGAANPFSRRSGHVKTLAGLRIEPAEVFTKSVHSAMFAANADGQGMDYWLRKRGIGHLIVSGIRTEQCCETTARVASDLGYNVVFVTEATATMPLRHPSVPADAPYEEVLADPRTLPADIVAERVEYVLAGRFATIRTLDELAAEPVAS